MCCTFVCTYIMLQRVYTFDVNSAISDEGFWRPKPTSSLYKRWWRYICTYFYIYTCVNTSTWCMYAYMYVHTMVCVMFLSCVFAEVFVCQKVHQSPQGSRMSPKGKPQLPCILLNTNSMCIVSCVCRVCVVWAWQASQEAVCPTAGAEEDWRRTQERGRETKVHTLTLIHTSAWLCTDVRMYI